MEQHDGQASPLTDVNALAHALAGPLPPVLLDVRWRLGGPPGIESYLAGHLPRAVFVDLDTELAAEPGPAGRHPLPPPRRFERGYGALYSEQVTQADKGCDFEFLARPGRNPEPDPH